MLYQVYHATGHKMFLEFKTQPREYAGFVEATSLEDAFRKSQNMSETWSVTFPCRSTSVGDIIQDEDGFHMVKGIGFKYLGKVCPDLFTFLL